MILHDLDAWPDDDWVHALNALSQAWRAGEVPGFLFNGTRDHRLDAIMIEGFQCSDGAAWPFLGGPHASMQSDVVHLGTPEVAAWYMADTAQGSEQLPCLVAVDMEAFLASKAPLGLVRLLADGNSFDWPPLTALGASTIEEVQSHADDAPFGWQRSLAVLGALCINVECIPVAYLTAVRTPEQLQDFIALTAERTSSGSFQAMLM
jgi:hypothetical protein